MKIVSVNASAISPVKQFQVDDLSDVVVIAGPNGVGKTRLVAEFLRFLQNPSPVPNMVMTLQATCEEERKEWGQVTITTSSKFDFCTF